MSTKSKQIDPRGPRFGAAITSVLFLVALNFSIPVAGSPTLDTGFWLVVVAAEAGLSEAAATNSPFAAFFVYEDGDPAPAGIANSLATSTVMTDAAAAAQLARDTVGLVT